MGFSARSKDHKVLEVCQDGGVVTTLLEFALNNGIIDGAVVARREDAPPWKPQPFVARTYDELLEAAGSKYTNSPNLLGLTEAITKYNLKKIAFVGLPCQIQSLRKIQISQQQEVSIRRLKLLIGLFCTETFSYTELIEEILKKRCNLRPERIEKFDIKKNKFLIQIENQEEPVAIRLKEMKQYAHHGCHYCLDFSSELADISVGSVGSPLGWSTVLTRTKIGDQIYRALEKSGDIDSKPFELEAGSREIVKATEKKQRENLQRIMDKVKKSSKFQFVYSTQPKRNLRISKSWYLDE
jgi:coenzyme F420 hydrogenase subunit beta